MYDARSLVYDDSWHPKFAAYMVGQLSLQQGDKVLDIAAGSGLASLPALAAVAPTGAVLGVDISDGMLSQARSKLAKTNSKAIHFENCNIADHDALQSCVAKSGLAPFDAAICASALVLLTDPQAVLSSWATFLKPGGRLVVDAPHEHNQRHLAMAELTARRLGIPLAFNRAWATGEKGFRDMLESAKDSKGRQLLHVESIHLKEQVGYGIKRYTEDAADAERLFESTLGPISVSKGLVEEFHSAFIEDWVAASEANAGVVEDVDGVYVAVVRTAAR